MMTVRELIQTLLLNSKLDDYLVVPDFNTGEDVPVTVRIDGRTDGCAYIEVDDYKGDAVKWQ